MKFLPTETAAVFILDYVSLHTYALCISLQLESPLTFPPFQSCFFSSLTLPSPPEIHFHFWISYPLKCTNYVGRPLILKLIRKLLFYFQKHVTFTPLNKHLLQFIIVYLSL